MADMDVFNQSSAAQADRIEAKSESVEAQPRIFFNQPRYKFILFGVDFVLTTLSFFGAVLMTVPDFFSSASFSVMYAASYGWLYLVTISCFIVTFMFNHLYKRNVILSRYRQLVLTVKAVAISCLLVTLFQAIVNLDYFVLYGRDLLLKFGAATLILFFIWRGLAAKPLFIFLAKARIIRRNVLIVGADETGKKAAGALRKEKFADFNVVGYLDDYKPVRREIENGNGNLGKLDDIAAVVEANRVDEILIAIDHAPYRRLIHIVESCLATRCVVRIYSDLFRVISEKMKVEMYGDIPVVMLPQQTLDSRMWSVKRNLDILLSLTALILLSPVFLAIAAGIKLSSPGPVIFQQTRIGKDGKPFKFYKFRSMHVGTDESRHKEYVQNFIRQNGECELQNSDQIRIFKIQDDPRIFRFGKFIRKTSLDEFPQLFNVLCGDMTLVGPRPCLPYEWECYDDWHKERLKCLPGCTGIWQALGRSSVTFEEMVLLDLYYVSNMTVWLDLEIVLHTIPVIFLGKGAY